MDQASKLIEKHTAAESVTRQTTVRDTKTDGKTKQTVNWWKRNIKYIMQSCQCGALSIVQEGWTTDRRNVLPQWG